MPPRETDAPHMTAFGAGLAARLGLALAAMAVLWLAVFWALA
ncbi:MAG: hypothetical protein RH982_08950 [Parvibaculum sp.]